jgi:hypothetical protein
MDAPTLFPKQDISLNGAQMHMIEKILRDYPRYNLGFSIWKDGRGNITYYGILHYTDRNHKSKMESVTRATFGEVVTELVEKIHALDNKKSKAA